MDNDKTVYQIRISKRFKAQIRAAADNCALSMADFLKIAAVEAIEKYSAVKLRRPEGITASLAMVYAADNTPPGQEHIAGAQDGR